jgi:multimeric flavodoxin WrbA
MNVLVINSSPFSRRSNTALILNAFLSGVRENGGNIEIVELKKLSINPCRGDLHCWFHSKGKCVQNDDMTSLLQKFTRADIIVFSTPVYCDGVPGQLKIMMDRLVVLGNPFLELLDDHTRHPLPPDHVPKKFILIASCGFWETDNFSPMIMHLKAFCKNLGITFSGALLRPHSYAMKSNDINDILRAAKHAGLEIIRDGALTAATEELVSKAILSREKYMESINGKAKSILGMV